MGKVYFLVTSPRATIVLPAYYENDGILIVLERILESVRISVECLVVVDEIDDPTVKYVKQFSKKNKSVKFVLNDFGRGPAFAIRKGFESAKSPVVVVTMADGSDDPEVIEQLIRLVERGVTVASASRYMAGGQQVGALFFKSILSKFAGLSLFWLARIGTHDATNSFKAYNANFVRDVGIESQNGFEIGLELTAKAKRLGRQIAEIPTIWLERQIGESNFKLKDWLPHYLSWYFFAFGRSESIDDLKKISLKYQKIKNRLTNAKGKNG